MNSRTITTIIIALACGLLFALPAAKQAVDARQNTKTTMRTIGKTEVIITECRDDPGQAIPDSFVVTTLETRVVFVPQNDASESNLSERTP